MEIWIWSVIYICPVMNIWSINILLCEDVMENWIWSVIYICPVMNIWSINRLLWRCDGDLNLICDLHLSCDEHLEYKQTLVWRCDGDLNLICDLHLSCDEHLEYNRLLCEDVMEIWIWSVIYICPVMNIWSINRLLWRCDGDLNLICDLHLSCDEHLEYKQTLVWRCDGDLNLICDLHLSCDEQLEYKQTLVKMWWRSESDLWSTSVLWWTSGV